MPADLVITPARKVALIRIEKWIESQVSVALSVFYDVHGWADAQTKIDRMLFEARHSRNRERYKSVLALSAPFEHLQSLQVPETHLLADAEMFPPPLAG